MPAARRFSYDPDRFPKAAFYSIAATTGSLTTIAAGTGTAGHLFVARYAPSGSGANLLFFVTRLRILWQTITGFTTAQEVAFAAYKLTGYVSAHTSGNAITPLALAPAYAASQLAPRISNTTTMAAVGPPTVGAQLLRGAFSELATSTTVPKGFIDEELLGTVHPVIVLAGNEGILVRNEILMGAGGTGKLSVELDGYERAA